MGTIGAPSNAYTFMDHFEKNIYISVLSRSFINLFKVHR